jgi:hypothetical protein
VDRLPEPRPELHQPQHRLLREAQHQPLVAVLPGLPRGDRPHGEMLARARAHVQQDPDGPSRAGARRELLLLSAGEGGSERLCEPG